MASSTPSHPMPSHPTPAFSEVTLAFPFNVMAFPFTGRSHLMLWRSQSLGFPRAWRWRQAMAKWRLGRKKWRGPGGAGMGAPRQFHRPLRHLAMAWRRRQAWRHSINSERHSVNWEHHNINWERHNMNWERHNNKWKRWGGVGWCCIWRYLVMK